MAAYGEVAYGELAYGDIPGDPGVLRTEAILITEAIISEVTGNMEFADTVTFTGIVASGDFWYYTLANSINFADAVDTSEGYAAKESVTLTPAVTHTATAVSSFVDTITVADIGVVLHDMASADTVTFTDAVAYDHALLVVEQLLIDGASETHLQAVWDTAELIAFLATGGLVEVENAAETVQLTAAIAAQLLAYELHTSGVIVGETATHTLTLLVEQAEGVTLTEGLELSQQLSVLISEGINFKVGLRLGTDVYAAWLVNTATKGSSRYSNFPFNSFAERSDGYYGAADDGIYRLQGTDDAGTDIGISIKTGLYDFGERRSKRVHDVFLGVKTNGGLVLKVTADEQGVRTEAWYNVTEHGVQDNHRAKVGKGLRGVYWGFELVNVDGADVDLDNLQLYPLTLTRRV